MAGRTLISFFIFVALSACLAEAGPNDCCFPSAFQARYEFFSDGIGFQADLYYSEDHGVRLDGSLWDPSAVQSRFSMFLLKEGHFYTYNVSTNTCNHQHCESCFKAVCVGETSHFKYAGNITIGTQNAQKYAMGNQKWYYTEITLMSLRPGLCVPINELVVSDLFEESEAAYANSFYYNVNPTQPSSIAHYFIPPPTCHPDLSSSSSHPAVRDLMHLLPPPFRSFTAN